MDQAKARAVADLADGRVLASVEVAAPPERWIAVRPPLVTDGPHTGRYQAGVDVLHPGARISRADIADFMLAQAIQPTFARSAPFSATDRAIQSVVPSPIRQRPAAMPIDRPTTPG